MTTSNELTLCFSTEQLFLIDDAAARLCLPVTEFAERVLIHEAGCVVAEHTELITLLREKFLASDVGDNDFLSNEKLARAIKRVRHNHPCSDYAVSSSVGGQRRIR